MKSSIPVFFVLLFLGSTSAQMSPTGAPAPGPSTVEGCLSVLSNAADCFSFVEAGSTEKVPEKLCCGEIKSVISNHPECLCQMLVKNNTIGIEFDVKKALQLPKICKIDAPPISLCSLFGVPVAGAPTIAPSSGSSPGASPPSATAGATTNSQASFVGMTIALLSFMFAF